MVKYGIPLPAANAPNPAQPAQPAQPDSAAGPGTPDSTPALTPAPPIVSVTDLNPTQLFEYKTEIREWRTQMEKAEKQRKCLAELIHYILDRVSDSYRSRILNKQTPRAMICTLRQRVAPSDRAKEIEVLNTWKWLKKAPKDTYLATWLQKWEETYEKAQQLGLPEATGIRPVLDFIDAIELISEKFHTFWSVRIQDSQDEDQIDEIPDLYELLDKFRNHTRLRQLQKGRSATAFATYQGASADDVEQDEQTKQDSNRNASESQAKRPWPCPCGEQHPVDKCDHIHEHLRGKDWKEDLKRSEQIRKASKEAKALIKRSRKRVNDKQRKAGSEQAKPTQNAGDPQAILSKYQAGLASIALLTVSSPIRNSLVLNNATTDHVYNDIKLLHDFRPSTAPNRLESGTQSLEIQGYGTAYISVQTPCGPGKFRLNDVAYIPGYITNLVCFRRLNRGGIQWDSARARLVNESFRPLMRRKVIRRL